MGARIVVDPTNGPLRTLAEALYEAGPGDEIALPPGTHASCVLTKPVHLLGLTDDPVGLPVVVQGAGAYGSDAGHGPLYLLTAHPGFDLYVQNLTLKTVNEWHACGGFADNSFGAGVRLIFNRCLIAPGGNQSGIKQVNGCVVEVRNCSVAQGYSGTETENWNTTRGWAIVACRFSSELSSYQSGGGPVVVPTQYVVPNDYSTSAQLGYGPGYGAVHDVGATPHALAGTVEVPAGLDPADIAIYLFRMAEGGGIDPTLYRRTTGAGGTFSFGALTPAYRYYVWAVPPDGYPPLTHGPYPPVG